MKSELDDLAFLNSLDSTPTAPVPSSQSTTEPETSTALPTLPLDHPLYATLSPLLETLTLAQNAPESLDDEAIEQLMKRIESTELAADGLEDRLDSLLSSLDGMLGALENKGTDKEVKEVEKGLQVTDKADKEK